jgi:hypothetical protein
MNTFLRIRWVILLALVLGAEVFPYLGIRYFGMPHKIWY